MKPYIEAEFPRKVYTELVGATARFGPINSSHEAYAVILEELDEFWDIVKGPRDIKGKDREKALKELVQIAAMCWRAAVDLDLIEG